MPTTGSLQLPYPDALAAKRERLDKAARELPVHLPLFEALRDGPTIVAVETVCSGSGAQEESEPRAATRAEASHREHDRYFRVVRVASQPAVAFVQGLFLAHSAALDHALTWGVELLDDNEWPELFAGLAHPYDPRDRNRVGDLPVPPSTHAEGYDADERWLLGHRLFFVLIQGVIVGINTFLARHADGDADGAAEGLEVAAAFLRSSAVSFKFASDFDPDAYDRQVRPAMAPPAVREGFSGLQTRDHTHLVRHFGEMKRALAAIKHPFPARESFVSAMVDAYLAHQFICARFAGDVLPSLRMAAAARRAGEPPGRTGVEVLRQLAERRLLSVIDRPPGETR